MLHSSYTGHGFLLLLESQLCFAVTVLKCDHKGTEGNMSQNWELYTVLAVLGTAKHLPSQNPLSLYGHIGGYHFITLVFEIGSHFVDQAGLCLPCAGIKAVCHHSWPSITL